MEDIKDITPSAFTKKKFKTMDRYRQDAIRANSWIDRPKTKSDIRDGE